MEHAISLFFRSIFVDNMIFAYFLGMCSYLAVSKNVKTSLGLGLAVTFVLLITVPVDYLLQTKVLSADGILGVDLTYDCREVLTIALCSAGYLPAIDCRKLCHHGCIALHAAAHPDGSCQYSGYHLSMG